MADKRAGAGSGIQRRLGFIYSAMKDNQTPAPRTKAENAKRWNGESAGAVLLLAARSGYAKNAHTINSVMLGGNA